MPRGYRGNKPFLASHTSHGYPGYNLDIPDQRRADVWIGELQGFVAAGEMPAFQILRLPNDHTAGGPGRSPHPAGVLRRQRPGARAASWRRCRSTPFWESTAVFVLEDDAQNGPDHVDSHRSVLLVISPWTQRGVHHRWTNTTDVVATMTEILGLGSLSQFDFYGRPLRGHLGGRPGHVPLRRRSPLRRPWTSATRPGDRMPKRPRRWTCASRTRDRTTSSTGSCGGSVKGEDVPYPGTNRMSALEWKRGR